MITISTSGNSILFTFEDSQHYLYGNGVIDTPKNSLILVTDSSEMATFKKIDGDIFLSALYSELGMTKSELISYYEANMVGSTGGGGGGVTSGEVQTMIDESISGKADTSAVTESISGLTERIGEDEEVTSAGLNALNDSISGLTERIGEDEEVTAAGLNALNDALSGKVSTSAITSAVTSASTDSEIPTAKAVYDAIPTGGTGGDMPEKSYIGAFTTNGGKYYDYGDIVYLTANNTGNTTGYCQMANNCTWYYTNYYFDFTAHTVTASDSNNDDYISVVWDDATGMFKITSLTSGCSLYNAGGDNVKLAKVVFTVPSGTTEEYIETGLQDVTTIASMADGKSIDYMYYTLTYKSITTNIGLKDGQVYNPQIGLGDGLCSINNLPTVIVKSETFGEWDNVTIPANNYNAYFTETSAVTFTLTNALQEGCGMSVFDVYNNSYTIYNSDGPVNNDWDVTVDGNTVTATKRSGYNNAISIGYGCAALETVISNLQVYKTSYTIDEYAAKIESEGLGGNDTVELTQAEYDALVTAGTVSADTYYVITDAPAITTTSAVTSGSTDVITSGGVYEQLDGLKLQKVTQQEYDALVSGGTVDNNTLYVIV